MPSADSCIATQALARSVEERLGRHVFVSAAEADVSVEGRVEKKKGGWHAVLTIRDSKGALLGTRELDRPDASCDAMNEGLALVIAVMIDPEAKLSSTPAPLPPASSTAPASPPPPAPPPAPTVIEPPPPKPKDPLRVEGDVTVAISDGLAPTVTPGVQLAGNLWLPGIPVAARGYGALFLPTNAEADGARGSFDLVYVGSALCPTLRGPIGVAMLCIGSQIGVIRSHADSSSKDRGIDEKTMLLWNLVGELRLTVPIYAPIAITGGVGGVIPILRPTFLYTSSDAAQDREDLHKVSVVGLVTDVGIAFFFP